MTVLTTTARSEITLTPEMLLHLGVRPGDRLDVVEMPGGELSLRAKRTGKISDFIGSLKREGRRPLSIEEMNEIIAMGWAGEL